MNKVKNFMIKEPLVKCVIIFFADMVIAGLLLHFFENNERVKICSSIAILSTVTLIADCFYIVCQLVIFLRRKICYNITNVWKKFKDIDELKKQHYNKINKDDDKYYIDLIQKIDEFYGIGGKFAEMKEKGDIVSLFKRLTLLKRQSNSNANVRYAILSIVVSFGWSFVMDVIGHFVDDIENINSIVITFFFVALAIAAVISWCSGTDIRDGKYIYLINQYEVEVLTKKIGEMGKMV